MSHMVRIRQSGTSAFADTPCHQHFLCQLSRAETGQRGLRMLHAVREMAARMHCLHDERRLAALFGKLLVQSIWSDVSRIDLRAGGWCAIVLHNWHFEGQITAWHELSAHTCNLT